MNNKTRPDRTRLGIERLESRDTPAQFGIPWSDSMHLSLSFAPDGTMATTVPSELARKLDAQMPRATWQNAILQAVQTWENVANVNVGVVADGGQAFGVAGASQFDTRFGDIRVGGLPMDASDLAVAIPSSTAIAGTYSGDIWINSNAKFTPQTLYAAALHEVGHSLGLGHSTDPKSVMFQELNVNTTLTQGDVAAIRALYGARGVDLNEGQNGNDTPVNATRIRYSQVSGGYSGSTPLVTYGDISTPSDVDYYYVKGLIGYSGPMTFRVQSNGVSLLNLKITVFDDLGRLVATKSSAKLGGDTLGVTLPSVIGDARYTVKVESLPGSSYQVGRYAVVTTFDQLLKPSSIPVDTVVRGRYEGLSPEKLDQLFKSANGFLFEDDLHTDDTIAGAVNLRPDAMQPDPRDLRAQGSLSDRTDVDFYRVKSPDSKSTWVMTATLTGAGTNPVVPRVRIYDGSFIELPTRILVNGNGTFTVEVSGLQGNKNFFLKVSSPTGAVGNYSLGVKFTTAAAEQSTFVDAPIASATSSIDGKLYIARTQLFSFGLEGIGGSGPITMTITNAQGVVVYQLVGKAGDVVSGAATILTPGEYRFSFRSASATRVRLTGAALDSPIGPVVHPSVPPPLYGGPPYTYPNKTVSGIPYLWAILNLLPPKP